MSEKTWPELSDVNRVMSKLRSDNAFKSQLLRDANAALTGIGVAVPSGITVKVYENTASTWNFILPSESPEAELSEETLEAVAGGLRPSVKE